MILLIIKLIIAICVLCFLYERFVRLYFKKKMIQGIEKETVQWMELVNSEPIVNVDEYKKALELLFNQYQSINFSEEQIDLQFEIIKLMFFYVNTTFRLITQHGIQMTAIDNERADKTVEKMVELERRKKQLESILENIFTYLKENEEE